MSRYYNMVFDVVGSDPAKTNEIKKFLEGEWEDDGDSYVNDDGSLHYFGNDYLFEGEDEEGFCVRITKEIWKVNGAPCKVAITATYLEDLPQDTYTYDPEDPGVLDELDWKGIKEDLELKREMNEE